MFVANFATAVVYLCVVIGMLSLPGRPVWVAPTFLMFGFANVAFIIATWSWRKWGLYGAGAAAIAIYLANILLGHGLLKSLVGLAGFALLVAVAMPKWKHFK